MRSRPVLWGHHANDWTPGYVPRLLAPPDPSTLPQIMLGAGWRREMGVQYIDLVDERGRSKSMWVNVV